jgi:cytochrome c
MPRVDGGEREKAGDFMRAWLCLVAACIALSVPSTAAPIHEAAKSGDVAALTAMLDGGTDVNLSDGSGTPLYYAVTGRHFDAVKLLLAHGADTNRSYAFGPPLTSAAWKGDLPILKVLLDHGANPNSEFRTQTALHMAAERGSLECVEALVNAGADVNAFTKFREPPIHYAKKNGHEQIVSYLLDHGYVTPLPPPIADKLKSADPKRGRDLFVKECSRCHDDGPAMRKFRGPALWNVVGRPVAAIEDFKYSPVMRSRGGRWTYEDLNFFLSDPCRALPGTDMGSNGLQNETDRADLIIYLRSRSDAPPPI